MMSVRVISSLSVPAARVYVASSFISGQVKTMLDREEGTSIAVCQCDDSVSGLGFRTVIGDNGLGGSFVEAFRHAGTADSS